MQFKKKAVQAHLKNAIIQVAFPYGLAHIVLSQCSMVHICSYLRNHILTYLFIHV